MPEEGLKNITLVGFMGTGKTSVGKILAKKLARRVIDVDTEIENNEGRHIADIFEREGEGFFRQIEKRTIQGISKERGVIITTGGGAVLDPENIRSLKATGWVVCLSARPETIYRRVRHSRHRPLLAGKNRLGEIRRLLEIRKRFYAEADHQIETDGCTSSQVADAILHLLGNKLS